MTGQNAARSAEDIGGQELSYAEVKAIASGNPAVLTLAEADAEIQRLTVLKKHHSDEQFLARRSQRTLPETIHSLKERLESLTADMATVKAHVDDPMTLSGRTVFRDEAVAALGHALDTLPLHVSSTRHFLLGTYRGLRFGVVLHPLGAAEIYLEGAITRDGLLPREHHGPRAVLNALERLARGYDDECDRVRQDLGLAEAQLRDFQARLGQPFRHADYLDQLMALRDQLKAGLSGTAPEENTAGQATVAELAKQIKAIRAAHTIEAAPQRSEQRRVTAEEPVTARIRRRTEAEAASGPAMGPDVGNLPTDHLSMPISMSPSLQHLNCVNTPV